MRTLALALALLVLSSCSRDPNLVKVKYLQNGNNYFEHGRYKEASIMYRNALKKDALYGEAYYRLGLTELKLGRVPAAVAALRRALERIKPNDPNYWDAAVKLADIYLAVTKDKQYLDEAEQIAKNLLEKDPKSYHGQRISGDLAFIAAQHAFQSADPQKGSTLLAAAVSHYRQADAVQPGQTGLRLALARALSASRDYAGAEGVYRSVIDKDKTAPLAYTELYQLFLFEKKVDDAEAILKLAVANNPKQTSMMTMLATHYFAARRTDDGVKVLAAMKSNLKDFPKAYILSGDLYARLGNWDQAIKEYREGLARDTARTLEYRKHMIEALMRQGKKAEAAEINAAILKDNPKNNEARGFAASMLLDAGEVAKALGELQAVAAADPKNFVARFNLGRVHMARGEIEQARQQFAEASKQRPDYVPARLAMAQLHLVKGEFEAALQEVGIVLRVDPNSANARLIESAALMGLKRYGDSRQLLQRMTTAQPGSPDVAFQMGVVNLAENKFKEAEESFRKSYQLNPANSRGLMGVVETYMAQNRTEQALQVLEAEAQKAPGRMEFRVALANTAVRAGKYEMALNEYQGLLGKLDPKSRTAGEIYLKLGETNRRRGDLNGAIAGLQKAQEIMPANPMVTSSLALTLESAGRKQEARAAYEQTIKLQPGNAVALNNLAYLLAENGGDLDQALTYAQKAKQFLPDKREVSDTLGLIYLKKNLNDNAVRIFSELVARQPKESTFRYHLGLALFQKGDRARALQELQEALKNNPPRDEESKIRQAIARLT